MSPEACLVGQARFPCAHAGVKLQALGIDRACEVRVAVDPPSRFETISAVLQSLQASGYRKVAFYRIGNDGSEPTR